MERIYCNEDKFWDCLILYQKEKMKRLVTFD